MIHTYPSPHGTTLHHITASRLPFSQHYHISLKTSLFAILSHHTVLLLSAWIPCGSNSPHFPHSSAPNNYPHSATSYFKYNHSCDDISRLAMVRSGPRPETFLETVKKTGPYSPALWDRSLVQSFNWSDQTVQSGLRPNLLVGFTFLGYLEHVSVTPKRYS